MEFEKLYRENYGIVFGFLFSMCKNEHLTEELTARTFLNAFEHFGDFSGKSRLSTWLCSIAKNEFLLYQRKNKKITGLTHMGDFTSYDEMDYQYIVDNNRLVPEIKDFGTDKLSYRHYHKDDFVFYSDTYSVTAQYTDKQYEDMKKSIEEKYSFFTDTIVYEDGRNTLEPCFEMDGFFFRLLSYEYEQVDIPKNVYIFGFNDKTKQIVFIYFRDDDLDYIESYEEFMNYYCGWNK